MEENPARRFCIFSGHSLARALTASTTTGSEADDRTGDDRGVVGQFGSEIDEAPIVHDRGMGQARELIANTRKGLEEIRSLVGRQETTILEGLLPRLGVSKARSRILPSGMTGLPSGGEDGSPGSDLTICPMTSRSWSMRPVPAFGTRSPRSWSNPLWSRPLNRWLV